MIKNFMENLLRKSLVKYCINSIFVSLIDTLIVWCLYRGMGVFLVTANTSGVIIGFIIHYLISSKSVFQTDFGVKGFLIYLSTFLFGLALANSLIYAGEHFIFTGLDENLSFLLSKGISVLFPFFILYYIRRILFDLLEKRMISTKGQQS